MRVEVIAELPRRPPSEVEWEDLLVRMELMPRALRFVLEETGELASDGSRIVTDLLAREAWAARCLEGAAGVLPEAPDRGREPAEEVTTAVELVERFVRCRTRNFAMVQRRGVEVWDWVMTPSGTTELTAYQLLTFLVRTDVVALAALRDPGPRRVPVC